jgi:hypothetical protein
MPAAVNSAALEARRGAAATAGDPGRAGSAEAGEGEGDGSAAASREAYRWIAGLIAACAPDASETVSSAAPSAE